MKRIFLWLTVSIFLFGGLSGRAEAADIEAVLDSSDGSSAFVTKNATSITQALIDSSGNMVIKGGLRLDSSGTKYTTAESLIVDGKIGIGNTSPGPLLQIGDSGSLLGTLGLAGSASGLVTIQPAATAGTWALTLPADGGDDGKFLRTNGAGVTNWASVVGGGDVTGPSSSVDNEIALFSATTGKVIKRATTSGIVKATSGVISAAAAGTDYVAPNAAITGATNTKITYDAKGLVTTGASATLASADFANQGTTTTLLHGNAAGNPSFGAVVENDITLSDVTTKDVSTSMHGFAPKAPADSTKFLRGDATWAVPTGANTSLSNLASVAINTALLDDVAGTDDFGSATLPWKDFYLAGSSVTPASQNFRITGASTSGTRTITLPDASGTVALTASTVASVTMQVFTAAGAGTYTPTAGMKYCQVFVTGGGGASGDCTGTDTVSAGGGAGGTAIKVFTAADIAGSKALVVGAGGTRANPGGAGIASTFGAGPVLLTANGGGGSAQSTAGTLAVAFGGVGGTASGGNINAAGQSGSIGVIVSTSLGAGGTGGESYWGGGAASTAIDTAGVAGTNYGSGAAGAHASSATDRLGANGASGVIYIIEYM